MTPPPAQVWALRALFLGGFGVLPSALAGSPAPAVAFALAWGPNGLFLAAFMRGALALPRALVPVRRIEPVLYRWLGVGLVKRVVATTMWPLVNFQEPLPRPKDRQELLDRTELSTQGAEVCHGATLLLSVFVALCCLAVGAFSEALWILGFTLLLNGYPVMLQRANRWRVQQVRGSMRSQTQAPGREPVC
jgi:hypothetical protein